MYISLQLHNMLHGEASTNAVNRSALLRKVYAKKKIIYETNKTRNARGYTEGLGSLGAIKTYARHAQG